MFSKVLGYKARQQINEQRKIVRNGIEIPKQEINLRFFSFSELRGVFWGPGYRDVWKIFIAFV